MTPPKLRARSNTYSNSKDSNLNSINLKNQSQLKELREPLLQDKEKEKEKELNNEFNFNEGKVKIEENIELKLNNTLLNIADYFHGELMVASEDITLLETLNKESLKQFNKMSHITQELIADGHKMNQAFSDFEPLLKQVDEINRHIDYLELVAAELDDYSFELEEKVQNIRTKKEKFKKSTTTATTTTTTITTTTNNNNNNNNITGSNTFKK